MDMKKSIFINRLNKLQHYNRTSLDFKNKDLYKLIIKQESLLVGYEKIKSKKASSTPGTDSFTFDKFSPRRILNLRALLQNESWKPKPARRVLIPKRGKVEKRPLDVQDPEDLVVQAVVCLVLESIYEGIFSPFSYGFRPGRGTHDALKFIDENYDGVVWAIEGDIKGMFENVNHHILIKLLEKSIEDDRFIRLIWKLLRAGYLDGEKNKRDDMGIPQGSVVSPILANIYLHELDVFMEKFCKNKAEKRSPNRRTPPFNLLEMEMRQITRKLKHLQGSEEKKVYISLYKRLKNKSLGLRRYTKGSDRLLYTRYADNFIIGIAGSKALAIETTKEVKKHLETLGLTLSEDLLKITPLRKNSASFLGYSIKINTSVKVKRVRVKGRTPFTRRVTGKFVSITAPINDIVQKLFEKGFCDPKGKPTHKNSWITQEDNQIINLFNLCIRGLFGYYSGVKEKHAFSRIWYIFKFSCAMTLAAKHSCSLAKIFEKHGRGLKVFYGHKGEKQIVLYQPDLKKGARIWQTGKVLPDPYRYIAVRLSKTKIYDKCAICGADSAEMHHVRNFKGRKITGKGL